MTTNVLWRKDGTALPVEYGATPMLKDGVAVGSVVSFTDITERIRKQQEAGGLLTQHMRTILRSCRQRHR